MMTLVVDEPRIQKVVGSLNRKLLINGEWVDAASGRTFESLNPATEEVLASVAYGEAEDVDRAVRASPGRVRRRRRVAEDAAWPAWPDHPQAG
jgi:phenylacetaldehyde dehydrogenase